MQTLRTIVFAVIGLFLAVRFSAMYNSGYLNRWEKLPVDSKEVLGYFSVMDEFRYPRAADVKESCNYSSPAFSWLSNSPQGVADCVEFIRLYPEGTSRYIFVRDDNGNVWEWSNTYILNFYSLIWTPVIGLFFGIILSIFTKKPPLLNGEKT